MHYTSTLNPTKWPYWLMILLGIFWLTPVSAQQSSPKFVLKNNTAEKRVEVWCDGKLLTNYLYSGGSIKKTVLYPIYTADGTMITRGWPLQPQPGERVDHPHHIGSWFNYGDVNGLDFWNNSDQVSNGAGHQYGTIVHSRINKVQGGTGKGILEVSTQWLKPDSSALLQENTRFVFSGSGNIRIIDRITTLTALKENVQFKDNKEGLFALRVARFLEHPSNQPEKFTDAAGKVTDVPQLNNQGVTGLYHSSEGLQGDSVWGTRARWVNLTGQSGGKPVSVVMMDHPGNVGFPGYWHARGYGLFAINNLGQKAMSNGKQELNYSLPAGKSVTFKHRLVIVSGSLTPVQIDQQYQAFAKQ